MTREEFDNRVMKHCQGSMHHFHRITGMIFTTYDLTPPQGAVLAVLHQVGECPITQLSQELCVTKGSLSALCKRMEAQGLVARRRSREDERFVYISMTPRGRGIIKKLEDIRGRFYASRRDALDDRRQEEIIRGLEQLESYAGEAADEFVQFLEKNGGQSP